MSRLSTKPFGPDNRPSEQVIVDLAKHHGCPVSNICVICARKIVVQVYMNSGVCCEQHRKDRDNDHTPASFSF